MSGRSSTRELVVLAGALVACGSKAPEADPAAVTKLAQTIATNTPAFGGVRACGSGELVGATLTHVTLAHLAHQKVPDLPYNAAWASPPELDAPAARVLLDASPDATEARRAAAALLAAPSYVVYRLDSMDAPMAFGMKTPKRGAMSGRAIRYDRDGRPVCVTLFAIRNDEERAAWAIAHSDRAIIDPEVAQALREDLAAQYVLHAPRGASAGSAN